MLVERPVQKRLRITWILGRANLSGGVRVVKQLAEHMALRGHCCTIAYLPAQLPWPPPWRPRTWARRAANAWRTRGKDLHHLVDAMVDTVEVCAPRVESHHVPDADVVIATWWETMEWIARWPREKGAHAYLVQHHELYGGDPRRVRATYRAPALKLTVAKWLRDLMRDTYGDSGAVLIPNGIDFDQFDAPPRERSDPPTVGVMTSISDWKRTDLALEAIRLAQARLPQLRVLAFGAEPLRVDSSLPAHFEFRLRPAQSELASLYSSCDVWLLASDSEGFGLPGLEAAACRCPVVATRCGGPEDFVVDGRSGYLVPRGDAQSMAQRLLDVLCSSADKWRQMSDAAHANARRFSWPRTARTLERALLRHVERPSVALPALAPGEELGSGVASRRARSSRRRS
jgi:glycosyltransferase involved in cell wall biosynthesis